MPIKTRIDMLATGIKTPVGIKVAGPDLAELERIAAEIETVVRQVPGTSSVFAERVMGGNYIEFNINRDEIARYGLAIGRRAGSARSGARRHAPHNDGGRPRALQHQSSLRSRFS